MASSLTKDQTATVTVLLQSGKTIKEIAKFAELDRGDVTSVARSLDLAPASPAQKRAKELFGSADGLTYADVAAALKSEGHKNDEGGPVHYLTVATWVANHGWPWGGAKGGVYAPDRTASSASRSKYTLRMSRTMADEVNNAAAITRAANAAWAELTGEGSNIVAVAVVKGAAAEGVTDLAAVKAALLDAHGEELRTARA